MIKYENSYPADHPYHKIDDDKCDNAPEIDDRVSNKNKGQVGCLSADLRVEYVLGCLGCREEEKDTFKECRRYPICPGPGNIIDRGATGED